MVDWSMVHRLNLSLTTSPHSPYFGRHCSHVVPSCNHVLCSCELVIFANDLLIGCHMVNCHANCLRGRHLTSALSFTWSPTSFRCKPRIPLWPLSTSCRPRMSLTCGARHHMSYAQQVDRPPMRNVPVRIDIIFEHWKVKIAMTCIVHLSYVHCWLHDR